MGDALAVDDLGAPDSVLWGETVPRQNNLIRVPQLVGADDLFTARNGGSRVSSDRGAVTLGDETPLPRHGVDLVERYEVALHLLPGGTFIGTSTGRGSTEVSGMG
ncbi:MAG TPA: hypothetical protein VGQ26_02845 [Streptosporangiaceae bacterium]|jgi:hypothetical protein|nr:hypothetical protein [Streptosporangiaceae bacterium]